MWHVEGDVDGEKAEGGTNPPRRGGDAGAARPLPPPSQPREELLFFISAALLRSFQVMQRMPSCFGETKYGGCKCGGNSGGGGDDDDDGDGDGCCEVTAAAAVCEASRVRRTAPLFFDDDAPAVSAVYRSTASANVPNCVSSIGEKGSKGTLGSLPLALGVAVAETAPLPFRFGARSIELWPRETCEKKRRLHAQAEWWIAQGKGFAEKIPKERFRVRAHL